MELKNYIESEFPGTELLLVLFFPLIFAKNSAEENTVFFYKNEQTGEKNKKLAGMEKYCTNTF